MTGGAPEGRGRARRTGLLLLGVLLVVLGVVFTLQGLGRLAGSPMTGVTLWAVVGPIIAAVGVAVLLGAGRGVAGRPRG